MKTYLKNLYRYLKVLWWFRITLSQIFVFNLKEDHIICCNLNEKQCEWLTCRVHFHFITKMFKEFSTGNTIRTNIEKMLQIKYPTI
jgi:hypothetical protein